MLKGAVEYILGVRPILHGIMIDPCIPKKWTSFKMTRKFRGKIFEFHVENPRHISKGVKEVFIENEKLNGQMIDFSDPKIRKIIQKKTHLNVKVIMG
jgi:cellobiose phosphorylase